MSWNQFADRVHRSARSLVHLGVGVQDRIAVFSQNKPESLFVEFGAFRSRAVCVPFYATTSGAQVQFMMNDAEIRTSLWANSSSMTPFGVCWGFATS